MKTAVKLALAFVAGGLATGLLIPKNTTTSTEPKSAEKKPLYWVAPMDASYRRDNPGKSPMGMDLVPVYEESTSGEEYGPGVVTISPSVVNNMGVRTEVAQLKSVNTTIKTVGYVQYDQDQLVHIHPRVSGWVEKLYVKAAGEPVKEKQPLYTLYSPQLVNAQEEYLLALKRNNSTLVRAAKQRLEALQLDREFIQTLKQKKVVHESITFYAPKSGVVSGLKIREGFYVQPGNTLMSIATLEDVWVEAEVYERDASQVKKGQQVVMTLDYHPSKEWAGLVDYVYPTLNAQTRTLRVRLKFKNQDNLLKPNMFAQVVISADVDNESIWLPEEAVIRTGEQNRVVLALEEGKFKSIAVELGRVVSDQIEVLSGVSEGERIVTSAQFLIDSESSKNSDFKRMDNSKPDSVWMQGYVNDVDHDSLMANITHEAVAEWDWPEMTMDFNLASTSGHDTLKAGHTIHFEVNNKNNDLMITTIHIVSYEAPQVASATVDGVINTIDIDSRTMNISREAIDKWQRPAATMDFKLDNALDISMLKSGQKVNFTFEIRDDFVIVSIAALNAEHHH